MKKINFTLYIVLLIVVFTTIVFVASRKAKKTELVPIENIIPVKGKPVDISPEKGVYYGKASYYGEYWDGRNTANMEIFDCKKLTCASPILPFNTVIKVTNLENCKSVLIRVNDRGPYKMDYKGRALKPLVPHPKRVLDLSKASFKYIADLKVGVLDIKYEIIT